MRLRSASQVSPASNPLSVGECVQHLGGGLVEDRVAPVGDDFVEGDEHERALVQSRVRHHQIRFGDALGTVREQIYVYWSRSVADSVANPTHACLDCQEAPMKRPDRHPGVTETRQIEVVGLRDRANGFGEVYRGNAGEAQFTADLVDRGSELVQGIALVGAEPDEDVLQSDAPANPTAPVRSRSVGSRDRSSAAPAANIGRNGIADLSDDTPEWRLSKANQGRRTRVIAAPGKVG
jgi:hypothetical protein